MTEEVMMNWSKIQVKGMLWVKLVTLNVWKGENRSRVEGKDEGRDWWQFCGG
jgi:hypothetical protein